MQDERFWMCVLGGLLYGAIFVVATIVIGFAMPALLFCGLALAALAYLTFQVQLASPRSIVIPVALMLLQICIGLYVLLVLAMRMFG